MSNVSRKIRIMAALAVAGLAPFAMQAQAENLLLKRADGTTYTTIPLITSNGCTVVSGGDIEVRPQPTAGTSNDGWCPGGILLQLPTVSVTVNDTSLAPGDTVNVTWGTTNTDSCIATAMLGATGTTLTGWTGTRTPQQAAPGLPVTFPTGSGSVGTWRLRLTCTNSTGSTTGESPAITVEQIGQCSGVNPDFGLVRQTSMTNNNNSLQGNTEHPNGAMTLTEFGVIAGPWPARTQNGTIAVRTGSFVALKFNTGTLDLATYGPTVPGGTVVNRFGVITTITPAGFAGNVMLSYSTCPGQFETADLPGQSSRCRVQAGPGPWSWGVGTNEPFICNLQPGTEYYLNIAYVDFSTGLNNCSGEPSNGSNPTSCHWFGQPR